MHIPGISAAEIRAQQALWASVAANRSRASARLTTDVEMTDAIAAPSNSRRRRRSEEADGAGEPRLSPSLRSAVLPPPVQVTMPEPPSVELQRQGSAVSDDSIDYSDVSLALDLWLLADGPQMPALVSPSSSVFASSPFGPVLQPAPATFSGSMLPVRWGTPAPPPLPTGVDAPTQTDVVPADQATRDSLTTRALAVNARLARLSARMAANSQLAAPVPTPQSVPHIPLTADERMSIYRETDRLLGLAGADGSLPPPITSSREDVTATATRMAERLERLAGLIRTSLVNPALSSHMREFVDLERRLQVLHSVEQLDVPRLEALAAGQAPAAAVTTAASRQAARWTDLSSFREATTAGDRSNVLDRLRALQAQPIAPPAPTGTVDRARRTDAPLPNFHLRMPATTLASRSAQHTTAPVSAARTLTAPVPAIVASDSSSDDDEPAPRRRRRAWVRLDANADEITSDEEQADRSRGWPGPSTVAAADEDKPAEVVPPPRPAIVGYYRDSRGRRLPIHGAPVVVGR